MSRRDAWGTAPFKTSQTFHKGDRIDIKKTKSSLPDSPKDEGIRLRDELLALVDPLNANPNCSLAIHNRHRSVGKEAAMYAKYMHDNSYPENNQIEEDSMVESVTLQRMFAVSDDLIFKSAEAGDVATIKKMIRRGYNCNVRGFNGETPLHLACRKGHLVVAKLLLNTGADVHVANNANETAVHFAAYGGHDKIINLLLLHDADPNSCNGFGESPTFFACRKGFTMSIYVLLAHGADLSICDNFGETAIDQTESNSLKRQLQHASKLHFSSTWTRLPQKAMHLLCGFLNSRDCFSLQITCVLWKSYIDAIPKRIATLRPMTSPYFAYNSPRDPPKPRPKTSRIVRPDSDIQFF